MGHPEPGGHLAERPPRVRAFTDAVESASRDEASQGDDEEGS
ncbi:helix-turn-helix domain protein [Mycobacterium avium subsp. avium 2285 (R)]|nr:helix-turn-helix domain protein [Mycobacterium avium subsp. avium 2285 (R)]